MNKKFLSSVLFASAMAFLFSSCQEDKATLFFLAESSGTEGGASFTIMYKGRPYERTPIFSASQFSNYSSTLAPDGSYGVVLTADKKYVSRLYTATATHIGGHVLPVMNGLAFEPQIINQPVQDGKMVIWNGLNGYDLKLLANTIEPFDREREEKRFLEEDPRPRPKFNPILKQGRDQNDRVIPELPSYSR